MAAIDWTDTETVQFADIVLPGATYLETEGTRCSFEGKLLHFPQAAAPPSGKSGTEVLRDLAVAFNVDVHAACTQDITDELDRHVRESLGNRICWYWNTGEERIRTHTLRFVPVQTGGKLQAIPMPLTPTERYRREILEVGTARYKVHY